MSKELFVSSTPHETKVSVVEDEQLTEIYFERENEYTLAGSIYKGKVTRVLPGMQSAFVEIGLERDAFLYVTDFVEPQDEDGEIETIPHGEPQQAAEEPSGELPGETRRGGRRGRGDRDERPAAPQASHPEPPRAETPRAEAPSQRTYQPIILPGESLSKYRRQQQKASAPENPTTEAFTPEELGHTAP